MSVIDALSTIKLDRASVILMIAADTIACGVLILFVCWPSLIATYEPLKLAMLAVALTLPFVTAGTSAYLVGAARQDYDALPAQLNTAVIYGVSMHVVAVLLSLATGAMATRAPGSVGWPAPTSPIPAFCGVTQSGRGRSPPVL